MVDDKSKSDGRGRARVAGSQAYEIQYLMQQAKVWAGQARDLIRRNDREALVREARELH